MAGKKQHYVPQFLLKNFSPADDVGRVMVYRINEKRFLGASSTVNQAQENYFYGVPAAEDGLAKLEGAAKPVVECVTTAECLPARGSSGHHTLLTFALTQSARTRAAANERNAFASAFYKRMMRDHPELKHHLDKFTITIPNAPLAALASATNAFVHAYDLSYKLLCNRTAKPFLLSDHPAVMYNQFLEHRKKVGCNTGLAVKGLQLFLPLGPRHLLLLFDAAVYTVGGKRLSSQRVEVTCEADVFALNLLQAVSAEHCLYYGTGISQADMTRLMRKAEKYRTVDRVQVHEYQPPSGDLQRDGLLLRMSAIDVRTHLKLHCIRLTPHAQGFRLGSEVIPFRQPEVRRVLNEFDKAVRRGLYTREEMERFVDELHSGTYSPAPPSHERYQLLPKPSLSYRS